MLANQCAASKRPPTDVEVQILSVQQVSSLSLNCVLQRLQVVKHVIRGDGSCLYHAIAHQFPSLLMVMKRLACCLGR